MLEQAFDFAVGRTGASGGTLLEPLALPVEPRARFHLIAFPLDESVPLRVERRHIAGPTRLLRTIHAACWHSPTTPLGRPFNSTSPQTFYDLPRAVRIAGR